MAGGSRLATWTGAGFAHKFEFKQLDLAPFSSLRITR
jgi:hypothetical protein